MAITLYLLSPNITAIGLILRLVRRAERVNAPMVPAQCSFFLKSVSIPHLSNKREHRHIVGMVSGQCSGVVHRIARSDSCFMEVDVDLVLCIWGLTDPVFVFDLYVHACLAG